MPDNFDPYLKWLAIPPEEQPPNYYRLLGAPLFIDDPDVIETAADQRMMLLRSYQTGKRASLSQKILNEVSEAKVCLLTPQRKAAYDAELRAKLEPAPRPQAQPAVVKPAAVKPPPVEPQAVAPQTTTPQPVVPQITSPSTSVSSRAKGRSKHKKQDSAWVVPGILGTGVIVIVIIIILIMLGDGNGGRDGTGDTSESTGEVSNGSSVTSGSDIQTAQTTNEDTAHAAKGEPAIIAIWPTHNSFRGDRGTDKCDLHLYMGNNIVWSKSNIKLNWSRQEENPTKIRTPAVEFDKVRVETTGFVGKGNGLNEIEVIRGGINVARSGAATASARIDQSFDASRINDGIIRSTHDALGYWCLPNGQAGWIEIDLTDDIKRRQLDQIVSPLRLKDNETAIVIWNTHNYRTAERGTTEFDLRLFLDTKPVWKKKGIKLRWSKDEEPHEAIRLPQLDFDSVRIDVTKYVGNSGGLSEIAVLRNGTNIARFGTATCSAMFDQRFSASRINDGITHSNTHGVGYWVAPNGQAGWVSIDLTGDRAEPPLPLLSSRVGEWIDLMPFTGRRQDTVLGTWQKSRSEVVSAHEDLSSRITIPVVPLGDYDLEIEFTRTSHQGYTCIFVPLGSRLAMIVLEPEQWGVDRIDGRRWGDNETSGPSSISKGKRYRLFMNVRSSDSLVTVEVDLDGQKIIHWEGDPKRLSLNGDWYMPWVNGIGLGSRSCGHVFHSVRLRMINGRLGSEVDLKRFVPP